MTPKLTKPTSKPGKTGENTPLVTDEMIAQFVSVTDCPVSVARNFLEANKGNAALALQYFYEAQIATKKPTAGGELAITEEHVDELLGFAAIPREAARRLLQRIGGDIEAAVEEHWRDVSEPRETAQGGEASGTARPRTQQPSPVRPAVIRMQNPNVRLDNRPRRMPSEAHIPSPDTPHKGRAAESWASAQVTSTTTHISETQQPSSYASGQSSKGKDAEFPTDKQPGSKGKRQSELNAPPPIDKGKNPEVRKPPINAEHFEPEEPTVPIGPPKTSSRSFAIFAPRRQDPNRFLKPPAPPPAKPTPVFLSEKRILPGPLAIQKKPQAKPPSSDPSSQELPPMRNSPSPGGPPSSPPSTPPPATLASPDECWNPEQREYLMANAKGGGLDLIRIARRYEEEDPHIVPARSALLTVKNLSQDYLAVMILSMSRELIDAIIFGDLARLVLGKSLTLPGDHDQPCWYFQAFVDPVTGEAPSANNMLVLINAMATYSRDLNSFHTGGPPTQSDPIKNPKTAEEFALFLEGIDTAYGARNWDVAWNQKGWHRFFTDPKNPNRRSEISSKRDGLQLLVDCWKARLNRIPAGQRKQPLRSAPMECGYTKEAPRRYKEQRNQQNLQRPTGMILIEAISKYYNMRYRWCYFVVAHMSHVIQASTGEAFLSRIARTYTWQCGFNPVQAGESVSSAANDFSISDSLEWPRAIDMGLFDAKYKLEQDHVQSERKRLEMTKELLETEARIKAKKAQNARVKAEIAEKKFALEDSRLAYRSSIGPRAAVMTSERLQWKLPLNEKAREWATAFQEYIDVEKDETRRKALERTWVDLTVQGLQKANEVLSLTQRNVAKEGEGRSDNRDDPEDVEMVEE